MRLLLPLSLATASTLLACGPVETPEVVESQESRLGSDGGADAAPVPQLAEVASFGPNPGALKMFEYAPAKLTTSPAVIVVLHGCNQGAADVANTGWNDMADQLGFLVVYPEQVTANNNARCFNWGGVYGDLTNIQRGKDENQSIKEMVDSAVTVRKADPKRVFIVGFSAGGGQAAVMAATWPELFAAGATIAGIPYHCNTTFAEAFSCQKPGKDKTPAQWAALVKEAYAGYAGAFPRMSIWQGANDNIVGPTNRGELVEQWTEVHGVGQTPSLTDTIDGAAHSVFKDKAGKIAVETYEIPGMEHGVAIAPAKKCGNVAANSFAVDKGICTAAHVTKFFGLTAPLPGGPDAGAKPGATSSSSSSGALADAAAPTTSSSSSTGGAAPAAGDVPGSAGATCSFTSSSSTSTPQTRLPALLAVLALGSLLVRRKEVSR